MNQLIPDRISAEKDDPGYEPFRRLLNQRVRVKLDGVEQKQVLTADRAEGWIKRTMVDEDGGLVVDGDEIKTEIVRGKVELSFYE
jgi:hypothetical protein